MIMRWRKNSWLTVVDARKPIITVINVHVCMAAILNCITLKKPLIFTACTWCLFSLDHNKFMIMIMFMSDYDHYVANGNQA